MDVLLGPAAVGVVVLGLCAAVLVPALAGRGRAPRPDRGPGSVSQVRQEWHVYRTLVATVGVERHVTTRLQFSDFLVSRGVRSPISPSARAADFIVSDAAGDPLLAVRYADHPTFPTGETMPGGIPLLRFDSRTTLGQIAERVGDALGDRINCQWPTGPALLSTRIGSTWG